MRYYKLNLLYNRALFTTRPLMLTVENAALVLHGKTLLHDISFTLTPGRLYGLIGHNGSGKSSLIRLLSGELAPSGGRVLLDGQAIHAMPPKARARRIAYLPQRLPEAADFLVEELVMLGRFPWQGWLQWPSGKDRNLVAAAMAQQAVNTLSGGERQRAWLAMCLAQQSACLQRVERVLFHAPDSLPRSLIALTPASCRQCDRCRHRPRFHHHPQHSKQRQRRRLCPG